MTAREPLEDHRAGVGNEDTQCYDPNDAEHASQTITFVIVDWIHCMLYFRYSILIVWLKVPAVSLVKYTPVGTPKPW